MEFDASIASAAETTKKMKTSPGADAPDVSLSLPPAEAGLQRPPTSLRRSPLLPHLFPSSASETERSTVFSTDSEVRITLHDSGHNNFTVYFAYMSIYNAHNTVQKDPQCVYLRYTCLYRYSPLPLLDLLLILILPDRLLLLDPFTKVGAQRYTSSPPPLASLPPHGPTAAVALPPLSSR